MNQEVAEEKELPKEFPRLLWGKPIGLLFITLATLILSNTDDLESISTAGSAGFLLIFASVNLVGIKKHQEINTRKGVAVFAFILCAVAFAILTGQQMMKSPLAMILSLSILVLCFLLEYLYQRSQKAG